VTGVACNLFSSASRRGSINLNGYGVEGEKIDEAYLGRVPAPDAFIAGDHLMYPVGPAARQVGPDERTKAISHRLGKTERVLPKLSRTTVWRMEFNTQRCAARSME
jgi:hypothetical protein